MKFIGAALALAGLIGCEYICPEIEGEYPPEMTSSREASATTAPKSTEQAKPAAEAPAEPEYHPPDFPFRDWASMELQPGFEPWLTYGGYGSYSGMSYGYGSGYDYGMIPYAFLGGYFNVPPGRPWFSGRR